MGKELTSVHKASQVGEIAKKGLCDRRELMLITAINVRDTEGAPVSPDSILDGLGKTIHLNGEFGGIEYDGWTAIVFLSVEGDKLHMIPTGKSLISGFTVQKGHVTITKDMIQGMGFDENRDFYIKISTGETILIPRTEYEYFAGHKYLGGHGTKTVLAFMENFGFKQ